MVAPINPKNPVAERWIKMYINDVFNRCTTVVINNTNSIPAVGTPQRATYDADNAPNGKALNLHVAALKAWNEYHVASFGGAMLRNAHIKHHEGKIKQYR